MTPDDAIAVVKQARDSLAEIAVIRADTDNRIRTAYRLGIRKTEIAQLSGLARSTIDRILGHEKR